MVYSPPRHVAPPARCLSCMQIYIHLFWYNAVRQADAGAAWRYRNYIQCVTDLDDGSARFQRKLSTRSGCSGINRGSQYCAHFCRSVFRKRTNRPRGSRCRIDRPVLPYLDAQGILAKSLGYGTVIFTENLFNGRQRAARAGKLARLACRVASARLDMR